VYDKSPSIQKILSFVSPLTPKGSQKKDFFENPLQGN
jgi:hypothetical protein